MKTAAFHTLGCKVNTYDTESMMELFERAGYKIVDFSQWADVYIINTCTVTNMGDRKSRQMIRKAKRQNPQAVVAATGCYAQTSPEDLKKIPEVNVIVGNQDRHRIVELVEDVHSKGQNIDAVQDIMSIHDYEEMKISKVQDHARAFIKIQEGCNNFCSYCIIPYARGPVRSRRMENILEEARGVAQQGYKEIVVTGINVSSYGRSEVRSERSELPNRRGELSSPVPVGAIQESPESPGHTLIDVLKGLDDIPGIERIRLGSLEPMLLDGEFIMGLRGINKLCDHFHLSLQSGSDAVLKRMNRHYDAKTYKSITDHILKVFPKASLTTDIMVGFPGETEENFRESYDFVRQIGFSKLHVFKYSKRKGTPAEKMADQVPESVKEERSKAMLKLSDKLEMDYCKQFLGQKLDVLIEQQDKEDYNRVQGHTTNYILVKVQGCEDMVNKTIPVEITGIGQDHVLGICKE